MSVAEGRDDATGAEVFADFVRTNTPALLRTAYLLTGSSTNAEELVQDTLVRLYPKWQLVTAAEQPLAYVRRSLSNNFINDTRRASRREVAVETMPERPDLGPDAATRIADQDQLWRLLDELPARQRTALVLRFFHDLPDEQIADALDCRLGTVRSLISRGLSALRDDITRPDTDQPTPRRGAVERRSA